MTFSIRDQISIDIFPKGWDKTYCLQFIENIYNKIYLFGDRTQPGGSDHEIFIDSRIIGATVESLKDTINYVIYFLDSYFGFWLKVFNFKTYLCQINNCIGVV